MRGGRRQDADDRREEARYRREEQEDKTRDEMKHDNRESRQES
jgi:hypothetical protein